MNVKDEFVNNVLEMATEMYNAEQLDLLRNILYMSLNNYNITLKDVESMLPAISDLAVVNAKPYSMFFVAKKIEGLSEKSLTYYKLEIDALIQRIHKPFNEISSDDIRYYLATLQGITNRTVDNKRRVLSSFFGWLHAEEYINKNPMLKIKPVKQARLVRKPFTEYEVEQLRDKCQNIRELAIIDLLLSTGMRVGEINTVNRDDVNFQLDEVIVFGKSQKQRICYLNAKAKKRLIDYLNTRTDTNKALFVSLQKPHKRMGIGGIETTIRAIGHRAGVTNTHPHRFRRTAATLALNRGMTVEQLQQLLGHENISTTMIYAVSSTANVKQAHGKFLT